MGGDRGQIHAQALSGLSLQPGGQLIKGTGSRVEIDGVSHGRQLGRDRGQIHAQALPGLSLPPGGKLIKGTGSRVEIDGSFSWTPRGRKQGTDTCSSSSGTFSSTRWATYKGDRLTSRY